MTILETVLADNSDKPVEKSVEKVESISHLEPIGIQNCCKLTIDMHAANNPMMVCPQCKQIIKCFDDIKTYNNYRRFCVSRHRKILTDNYQGWMVVVFKSYDAFSS